MTDMFDLTALTPHGFCLAWQPGLIWLQAVSDVAVALAYYSIPLALIIFVRKRRDIACPWIFLLFAAFIVACGTTHIFDVVTLWVPLYWLQGLTKAITALLSLVTAMALWRLLPQALAYPSPAQLRQINNELSGQVHERETIAATLSANEKRLKTLYTGTPAPLHAVDMNGHLLDVSDRWLELFGYRRDAVIGRQIADFFVPDQRSISEQSHRVLIEGGTIKDQERQFLTSSGQERDVLVSAVLERDEDGQPSRIIAALTDITARKQAEDALMSSEEQLRQAQKMEAVGQLTGGIAHDFNNMLTIVMGGMELLKRRVAQDEQQSRLVDMAMQGAERAARLTGQLLAFSRRQRLVPQALHPAEVAEGLSTLLARTLGEQIAMVLQPPHPVQWYCLADRNQLESGLVNLAINARGAIAGEGKVVIAFGNCTVTADTLQPAAGSGEDQLAQGDYVTISVSDNGNGMTELVRKRAFEPFFTTKQTGEGTGLGLSQIYGFVRQSGGTVRIESEAGVGTSVTLFLPRAWPSQAHVQAVPAAVPQGQGETILLVEDEADIREIASHALEESGYKVITACDGMAALAALQTARDSGHIIDMLFTDIMMPGPYHGVDLALLVRKQHNAMRVLFATGYSDLRILSSWPGKINLLSKPYSIHDLVRYVADALATRFS